MKRILTVLILAGVMLSGVLAGCGSPDDASVVSGTSSSVSSHVSEESTASKPSQPLPVDDRTPRLGSFRFSNMDCVDAQAAACYCDGLPEMPIDEVTFENVRVAFAADARPGVPSMFTNAPERCRLGLYFENVRRVALKNVVVEGQIGDAVVAKGVDAIITE